MVDDRRRSPLERLERPQHRRPPDHLEVERAVEPPPDELEDLREVARRSRRRRHAAGQRRVEVMVTADEPARHARLGDARRQ